MFADPTITINAIANAFARTGMSLDQGTFSTADRALRLNVSHAYGKRNRRVIKLTRDSLVANPLVSGQNINQTAYCHIVVDTPPGYDVTSAKQMVDGFVAYLSASSGAVVAKLLAGES